MRPLNKLVIAAQDTDEDINSDPIRASFLFSVSVMCVVTTAGEGEVKLQASNDDPADGIPTNWVDIADASVSFTEAGVFLIPKTDICYEWIKLAYTSTDGGGLLDVRIKALGA